MLNDDYAKSFVRAERESGTIPRPRGYLGGGAMKKGRRHEPRTAIGKKSGPSLWRDLNSKKPEEGIRPMAEKEDDQSVYALALGHSIWITRSKRSKGISESAPIAERVAGGGGFGAPGPACIKIEEGYLPFGKGIILEPGGRSIGS